MAKFTEEETAVLLELLGKLQISPLHPDAAKTVVIVQSISQKITDNTERKEKDDAD